MVAKNVRVEFVRGPYDGCHEEFRDVLLRSTIELPATRFGLAVEEMPNHPLAIYKLDDCQRMCTPTSSTTVLRYQHTGFKEAQVSPAIVCDCDPSVGSRSKRLLARIWQPVRNWLLEPIEYPLRLASRD